MPVTVKNLAVQAAININVKMNFKIIWLSSYFIDEGTEAQSHRTSLNKIFVC